MPFVTKDAGEFRPDQPSAANDDDFHAVSPVLTRLSCRRRKSDRRGRPLTMKDDVAARFVTWTIKKRPCHAAARDILFPVTFLARNSFTNKLTPIGKTPINIGMLLIVRGKGRREQKSH